MIDKENIKLLKIDLCSRLPYSQRVWTEEGDGILCDTDNLDDNTFIVFIPADKSGYYISLHVDKFKPYLRSTSSMTLEEEREYNSTKTLSIVDYPTLGSYDWLTAHHFDYRGLIEKGLAIEAKEGMYD